MTTIKKMTTCCGAILAAVFLLQSAAFADMDSPWTGGGTGTTSVAADGSDGMAEFSYEALGPFNGSWVFGAIAADTGTKILNYTYTGFHSFFNVTASLSVFQNADTAVLVNAGPENCCTSPSAGFTYSGTVMLDLVAGDSYGFGMTGSHFDSAPVLRGILTVTEPTADDCKKGGWSTYLDDAGEPYFTNQGDCVSFFATGGKNEPGKNVPNSK